MQVVLYILSRTVGILIDVALWAMLVRVILQWTGVDEDKWIVGVVLCLTEPFIAPVRALLDRWGIGEDSPVDVAFFVTSATLACLSMFLPRITL